MLILASTSPYRKAQLEQLGLRFQTMAPGVDEDAIKAEGWPPDRLALILAEKKARAVAAEAHPGAVVIGGDQLVAFRGQVLGKPGSEERALRQLEALSGQTHDLYTALAVVHPEGCDTHLDRARLTLRRLSEAALRRYIALDRPVDCAGAYKVERAGIALFERIEADDPSAITGLPLMAVVRLLAHRSIEVP